MTKLIQHLDDNGLTEVDDGPWGALIVLASKPGQEDVPWQDFVWRLCVFYRRMNQVTRPFMYPIPRCDDAVTEIPPSAKYFIAFDLDCGYWQVALEKKSRAKTAFFTPDGKRRWRVMPMGFLNSHAIFVSMMADLKKEWDKRAQEWGIQAFTTIRTNKSDKMPPKLNTQPHGSKVIVDDVLLYSSSVESLLKYFAICLEVLQHHCCTIKLKNASGYFPLFNSWGSIFTVWAMHQQHPSLIPSKRSLNR